MTDSCFWKGKKVLVTGHTGFKGSWLCLWLQYRGASVVGYALEPPTTPSLFGIAKVGETMESIIADVRDLDNLKAVVARVHPDIVIHMAAQSLVQKSYQLPVETYATNVMGTVNLLEAVRSLDAPCAVVCVTSDKCYENRECVQGYRENDPMGGYDPYSSSKGCAELVAAAYRSSFFTAAGGEKRKVTLATARAGNVIGGGDWSENRLIPDLMKAFMKGEKPVIRNPQAIRPWQHVLDPLMGYLLLAEKLATDAAAVSEAWNFGPDNVDVRPVKWIADTLSRRWGKRASWELDKNTHPHEAACLKLDCAKARARLGWSPVWNLDVALNKTLSWWIAYTESKNMRQICTEQILAYEADARNTST